MFGVRVACNEAVNVIITAPGERISDGKLQFNLDLILWVRADGFEKKSGMQQEIESDRVSIRNPVNRNVKGCAP